MNFRPLRIAAFHQSNSPDEASKATTSPWPDSRQRRIEQTRAAEMVEDFFQEIRSALASGNDVKLSCFGGYQMRSKP